MTTVTLKIKSKPAVVAHTFNLSTQKEEAEVEGQPGLQSCRAARAM